MNSLEDACQWYLHTRSLLEIMWRLGRKHWPDLDWGGSLRRDPKLEGIEGEEIVSMSRLCPGQLDDLAVLVLFSAFESVVRDRVLAAIRLERDKLSDPHALVIMGRALEGIESGSFFRILDVYKLNDVDMVEQVNQVRRDRNWVAHGRRTARPAVVSPDTAYDRLGRFLTVAGQGAATTNQSRPDVD